MTHWMIRGLTAVCMVGALAAGALAQAPPDTELAEQIREVIKGKRIYLRETSPPEVERPRAGDGVVLHPSTDEVLQVVVLRAGEAAGGLRLVALVSDADHRFWTFAWRRGEAPMAGVVNGPYALAPTAPVERADVENGLRALIPPDGDVGFYDGMFGDLARRGRGVVPHLVAIARDASLDGVLRNLAVEALGECAGAADLDLVRELADDQQLGGLAQSAVYVLAKLGDRSRLDSQIRQMKTIIDQILKTNPRHPQLGPRLSELAIRYLRTDQFDAAIKTYQQAIQVDPDRRALSYYNLACAYALKGGEGDVDRGLDALEQAVKEGYKGFEWMKRDGDLKALRNHPRFAKLLQGRQKKEY